MRWNDNSTENPRHFVFDTNRLYTAYFAIDTYAVNVQVDNLAHGYVSGSGILEYGQPITVSATPYSGYQFSHWSDGSTYNPYTFAVLEDKNLTAIFIADGEPWQDTVVLYDTAFVTLHDTAYINVHDTSYIAVYLHDTTIVVDTLTLTEYVPVHDTTYIDVPYPVHDTTTVHDTTYVDVPYPVHDTTIVTMTDTITFHDTTTVFQIDTLWLTQHDTIYLPQYIHDTIIIHDTVVVGLGEVDAINVKIYINNGQIVIEGAEGNHVWLYDVNGRLLATKQDDYTPLRFDVPTSGTYLVKIGNHPVRKVVVVR